MQDHIFIKGARENNLKNIDVYHPARQARRADGSLRQRQVLPRVRHHLRRGPAPLRREPVQLRAACSSARWTSPTWTISTASPPPSPSTRRPPRSNPRSTVGTVTEIYDYLRLLWARIGTPHCPKCGKEIRQQTIDQIVDQVLALPGGHADSGAGPRRARAQGRAREGVRGRAPIGLCPCARGREPLRPLGGHPAREEQEAHTSRSSSTG